MSEANADRAARYERRPGRPRTPGLSARRNRRGPGSWWRRPATTGSVVLVLAALGVLVGAPSALADSEADPLIAAVVDHVTPGVPGVTVDSVLTNLGPQFVVDNPTRTEFVVLSSAGDPFLRIGPLGVLANIRSPQWYTSKTPAAGVSIPPQAVDHAVPLWGRVSDTPQWGWYDPRLQAPQLTPAQVATATPLQHLGDWSVPVQYGGTLGAIAGHFEYRPPLGQFDSSVSQTQPLPSVTLAVLRGNPTPALSVTNTGDTDVSVLGDAGEPFLIIGPSGTRANNLSPTWFALQNADDQQSLRDSGVRPDAHAAPQWVAAGGGAQYSFVLNRANPTVGLATLYAASGPTVVSNWTVTLRSGGRRIDVTGTTTLRPAGDRGRGRWQSPLLWVGIGIALVLLAAALVLRRRSRRRAPARRAARDPVGADRR